jgi:hypothetical protein
MPFNARKMPTEGFCTIGQYVSLNLRLKSFYGLLNHYRIEIEFLPHPGELMYNLPSLCRRNSFIFNTLQVVVYRKPLILKGLA